MNFRNRRHYLIRLVSPTAAISAVALVAACVSGQGERLSPVGPDGVWAPGVDRRGDTVSGLEVGHRLLAAGQYELAMDAFNRAALEEGLTAEVLSGLGSASLGLGRLGQAETLLRQAVDKEPQWPEALGSWPHALQRVWCVGVTGRPDAAAGA